MSYKVTGLRSWNINAEDFEAMVVSTEISWALEETRHHQVAGTNVERLSQYRVGLIRRQGRSLAGSPSHL